MKHLLLTLSVISVSVFSSVLQGQNVNVSVELTCVYRSSSLGDSPYGSPDPTWITSASSNGSASSTYSDPWCRYVSEMSGTSWCPSNALIYQQLNSTATTITLSLDAWENDCVVGENECGYNTHWYCPDGDGDRCTNNGIASINFRNDPPCQYNYYTTNSCSYYTYQVRIYWTYSEPPVVTQHPAPNTALCTGNNTTLTVSATGGRFYQWQYSINTDCGTPGTWTDITAAYNGGNPGTGYSSASYTPPQIPGTRLYRVMITSNCTASFSSNISYSNCARVTYNPMTSPPPIQSSICGQSVLPGSVHVFSTLQPPAAGAAANLTSPFYTWSATGGLPTSGSGSSFTWTAPSGQQSYFITLTYKSSCGDVSAAVCTVTVAPPPCGAYVYVSPTGTANNTCDPLNPCPSVSYVMNNYAMLGSPKYIRVSTGTINEPNSISLVDGLIIEGKYVNNNGVWTKSVSPTASTTLNWSGSASMEYINSTICHRVGIKSNGVSGWSLIDLNLTTAATNNNSTLGHGCSNYTIWLNNSSNYNILRCNITNGNAASGQQGASGSAGAAGGHAGWGGNGDNDGGGNRFGGAGGSGGGPGTGVRAGGSGGRGGDGESKGSCCNQAGSGSVGGNGGGGAAPDPSAGFRGGSDDDCNSGGDGGNAAGSIFTSEASAGATGTAGTYNPTNYTFSSYFTPAQAAAGNAGHGGGAGAGGGGGGGQHGSECSDGGGSGGGGGGGGGQGGAGGQGGFGGGATFGIYRNSNAVSGSFLSYVSATSGSAGAGGAGGAGGSGGAGGFGGYGGAAGGCSACFGNVGDGGRGSAGAPGGNGGAGAAGSPGVSNNMYTVGTGPATLNSSFPSTAPTVEFYAQSQDNCRYSELILTKTSSGSWTFPAGLNIVNDRRDAPAGAASSSYTTSSSSILVYTTSVNTAYDVTVGSTTYDDLLKTGSNARNLPSITVNPSATICYQGALTLSATTWGTVVEHEWRIYTGDNVNNPVFISTVANPTTPPLTCGSYPCSYTIRYKQREQCCGWSVPVFSTVTILPQFTRGVVDNTGKTICRNTQGNVNVGFSTPPTGSGGFTYNWYYKEGSDCPVSGSTSGWTSLGTGLSVSASQVNSLGNLDTNITIACWVAPTGTTPVCGSADWAAQCFVITVLPEFDPGTVQPLDETFCAGGNPSPVALYPPPQGSGFTYEWYYNAGNRSNSPANWPFTNPGCPSGTNPNVSGWSKISGATGATYDPPSINIHSDSSYSTPNDLYYGFAVFVTPTAVGSLPACGTAQWADTCRIIRETDGNFYPNGLNANYGNVDRSTNIWTATVCNGYNTGCSGAGCFTLSVHPTSGGGAVNDYTVTWETSTDFASWDTLEEETSSSGTETYPVTFGFTQPTYFRAWIYPVDPACGSVQLATNYWLINVLTPFDAGDITGDVSDVQCYGYNPPGLTANPSGIFPDGYLGSNQIYTDYKWEMSTDNGATWTVVSPYPVNAVLGTPTVVNESITTIPVTSGGQYYAIAPSVIIKDNAIGNGATGTVTINGSNAITGVTISAGGTGYTSATTVTFQDNTTGSGAAATVDGLSAVDSSITGITLNSGGTGFTQAGTVVSILNTSFFAPRIEATATATISGGAITGFTITNYGAGYHATPIVQITDTTTGHGAIGTVTTSNGAVTGVTITNGGSGYTSATTVTFTDNTTGSGATATANISGGVVTSITVNNGGSGYTATGLSITLGTENHSYNKTYDHASGLTDTTWFRYWVRPKGFSSLDCYGNPQVADDVVADTIKYDILPQLQPGSITGFTAAAKPQCLNYDPPLLTVSPTGSSGSYDYQWMYSTDQVNWNSIVNTNSPVYNPGPLTQTTYYTVVIDPNGSPNCPADSANILVIAIGQSTPAFAGNDATICNADYVFNANVPEAPGTGTWTRLIGSGTFSNANSATATVSGLFGGSTLNPDNSNVFEWRIVTTLCVDTKDTVVIYRDLEPDNANAGPDLYVCDADSVQLNGNALTVWSASGQWTRLSGTGDILSPTVHNTWVDNMLSGLNQFVWTTSSGICVDKWDAVNVFTSITPYMTWNGSVSTDWNDPQNWGCGNIPGHNTIAIIPLVNNTPDVQAGKVGIARKLEVQQFSQLNVSSTAKLGVHKKFVWANAGNDVVICSDYTSPFSIGNQIVLDQDSFANYRWIWYPSGDRIVYTDSIVTPDTVLALVDIIVNTDTTLSYGADTTAMVVTAVGDSTFYPGPDVVNVVNTDTAVVFKDSIIYNVTYTDSTVTQTVFIDTVANPAEPVVTMNDPAASTITFRLVATNMTELTDISTDSMRVTINRTPVAYTGPNQTYCNTPVQLGGASSGNNYTWSPSAGLSATNISNPQASPNVTTVYTLTETNPVTGCSKSNQVTVTKETAPTASVSSSASEVCSGGSVNLTFNLLTGTGPWNVTYTRNGSNPATLNGITNSSGNVISSGALTATTTFQITNVFDVGTGCGNPTGGSVSVTVNPLPSVYITATDESGELDDDSTTCSGDQVDLLANASGGTGTLEYAWNQSLGTNASASAFPTGTITYKVTVDDAKNCIATDSIVITVNNNPSVSVPPTAAFCQGSSVNITATPSGGQSPYTYAWTGGGTTQTISVSTADVYTVVVTDDNACTATDASTVSQNSNPSVSIAPGTVTICNGSSHTLTATGSGGQSPYTYTWSGNPTTYGSTKNVSPSSQTDYTVTVTDNNSCTGSATRTVNVNPTPSITSISATETSGASNNDGITCSSDAVTLTANATGGTPAYTYTWSHGGANGSSVSPSVTTNYSVTVGDQNLCSTTGNRTITVNPKPAADIDVSETSGTDDNDSIICNGYGSTQLTAIVTGGTSPYTYTWNPGIGSGAGGHTVAPTSTTTYYLTVTDDKVCRNNDSLKITVKPLPAAPTWDQHPATVGTGSNSVVYSVTGSGTYNWAFSDACIQCTGCSSNGNSVTLDFTGCSAGNYTVSVSETSADDCTGPAQTQAVSVIACNPPNINTSPTNKTVCAGGDTGFKVTATGDGLTYQWQVCTGTCSNPANWNSITTGGSNPTYSGYTSDTLALDNTVAGNNSYQYRCVVSGNCTPPDTSGAATLTVTASPSVTNHPSNASACPGNNASFGILATGAGLSYQWQVCTGSCSNDANWSNITAAGSNPTYAGYNTNDTLTLTSVASGNNGYQYRCKVNGTCTPPDTSNNATLTVNTVSTAADSIYVKVTCSSGTKQTVLKAVNGSLGTGASWVWYKGASCCGTPVASSDTVSDGVTNTITLSSSASNTTYYVRAEGTCGNSGNKSKSVVNFKGTKYSDNNALYWDQMINGTRYDVEYSCGSGTIYSWNYTRKVYMNGVNVLIPDKNSKDGGTITTKDTTAFYGWSTSTSDRGDTQWQFDKAANSNFSTVASRFKMTNLIVSPVSSTSMTFCKAIDNANLSCIATGACVSLSTANSTLAYLSDSSTHAANTTYNLGTSCAGCSCSSATSNGLISSPSSSFVRKIQQQQLDTINSNVSYCVKTYGRGWRLPTDIEAGHNTNSANTSCTNSTCGGTITSATPCELDIGYEGSSSTNIWTSSEHECANNSVRRYVVNISSTSKLWSSSSTVTGFGSSNIKARCVFDGGYPTGY